MKPPQLSPPNIHIALLEPEIPPNTGNIMRLCVNTGASLHLIEPLGFHLDDKTLRRAGMDYLQQCQWQRHASLANMQTSVRPTRTLAFSTHGQVSLWDVRFRSGDCLLFGPESRGLEADVLASVDAVVRVPMCSGSRSLNLSNCVAICCYEAWRQLSTSA